MISAGEWGGLIGGCAMAVASVVGAVVWLGNLESQVKGSVNAVSDLKDAHSKELIELDIRMRSMEDHKVSVAVLGSQMSMVLDRISELSRDVKNLLDGHARMAHIREREED